MVITPGSHMEDQVEAAERATDEAVGSDGADGQEFVPASTHAGIDEDQVPVLPSAKLQVLSGTFAGRELELSKALTTLGRPGVQVAAITRRAEGFYIVHVESGPAEGLPMVNGQPIGSQAQKLEDNDVIELAGVKMGLFVG